MAARENQTRNPDRERRSNAVRNAVGVRRERDSRRTRRVGLAGRRTVRPRPRRGTGSRRDGGGTTYGPVSERREVSENVGLSGGRTERRTGILSRIPTASQRLVALSIRRVARNQSKTVLILDYVPIER